VLDRETGVKTGPVRLTSLELLGVTQVNVPL
jgi:hypothetical protein